MTSAKKIDSELLAATVRRLSEQGYDVIVEPSASLLPGSLLSTLPRRYRPDAIAIGRHPKLIVEIASENPEAARRIAELQQALKAEPDWKLHLVLNRASGTPTLVRIDDAEIVEFLNRAVEVANVDARAALMMAWAALEALSRNRMPDVFARPQSPGRIVERLASEGIVAPSDANFLRHMAKKRNSFVHGDLRQTIAPDEVTRFISLLRELIVSSALQHQNSSSDL